MVARRLAAHAKQTQLVPDEQFGFRKKHSTTAQLARITDLITHGYNLRKHTGMVTLGLEKAYDTIWINGLLHKLIQKEFPAYLITFLFSYLRDRTFSVVINGAQSTRRTQRAGLPQGAALSPILFTYYISEIPRLQHIHMALYADDTALLTQSWRADTVARRLTSAIIHLKKYFDRWRLKLNTAKTEAILFTRRRPLPSPVLRIGQQLQWSSEVKYLGLHLTTSLTFTTQVRQAAHAALGAYISTLDSGFEFVVAHKITAVYGYHPTHAYLRGLSVVLDKRF